MSKLELKTLFNWCDYAPNNDEWWRRFVSASTSYNSKTQQAMIALATLMNKDDDTEETTT